ncbi:3-hydroxybenzoate 6-hydroxylase 1 [Trichoderma lentiforme]|uniref:3-hydroxybenzoate 6-hydroxylase 1 n=1 Tax=Trichoderma lentiforme TaxID=1567552 RepID=A0A9P4X948_9HYPO|nr:3-hydroxybenzoate 6-hydroxylase 1 [Trichoderma lentiforme]
MPIRVIIVGAGIGGLTAAVSLRQAGCEVTIFEKSSFVGEIGAALGLTPNGGRVLEHLGFSFQKARTCTLKTWATIDGLTYNTLNQLDLSNAQRAFGAPVRAVHRVDLHTELLRLATMSGEGLSQPVTLKLGSQVTEAHPDGTIVLQDGSIHTADLVVGADGLRSVVRDAVLSEDDQAKPVHSGQAAFRFLVDTSTLRSDPALASLADGNTDQLSLFADTSETLIWFECKVVKCKTLLVFILAKKLETKKATNEEAKAAMMAEFSHYDKKILRLFELAENVKRWPLYIHDPYPTWVKGRIVLVGDAAHPMLPFGGQGAMMAIEDGGILGSLFTNVLPDQIDARLSKFQQLRKNRVSRIQLLSSVRAGRENEVDPRISQYADGPTGSIPTTHKERTIHDYSYDASADLEKSLASDI